MSKPRAFSEHKSKQTRDQSSTLTSLLRLRGQSARRLGGLRSSRDAVTPIAGFAALTHFEPAHPVPDGRAYGMRYGQGTGFRLGSEDLIGAG